MRYFSMFLLSVSFAFSITILNAEAELMVLPLEQMIEKSDVIVVGTIQNTWIDIRPFGDYKIVYTATIRVEKWLKNNNLSETLEIRYYGDWSQKTDNLFGVHRSDTPIQKYDKGEKILLLASYEEPSMVMGEGYYPFHNGRYTIINDIVISEDGEKTKLEDMQKMIGQNIAKNTNASKESDSVTVRGSPAYVICSDLALECDYENLTASFDGTIHDDEIIVSLYMEGRGQNYTVHLDADAVYMMDGDYIRDIKVETENRQVDYAVDAQGKIDLLSIPIPINEKYHQVDYGALGHLIAEHDLKSKLEQRDIAYSEENYTFRKGISLDSYPPYSGYCALVKSDDGEDYWYEGGFHYDTLSRSELYDVNPNSCEPNSFSCTCSIIKEHAINNVGVLTYFDESQEKATARALQEYLTFTKVSNVPNQFVVGKYNFDYDGDYVSFCGKFVEPNTRNTFEGAINDSKVTSFSMRPPMELCAINDNAIVYDFEYLGNED